MYQIWYDFFLNNFFSGVLPSISWLPLTIDIACVVMCFLTVFLAILFICAILKLLITCFGWWGE